MRGQFRPVMESGFRPQRETVGQFIRRDLHGLGNEAVHRVGLVGGAHHQRRKRHVHALSAFALQDVGIERVEGLIGLVVGAHRRDQRKQPTLGRVHIDVVEMMKVRGIFQIAEYRHAMRLGGAILRQRRPKPRSAQRADAETEHMPAGGLRHAGKIPQDRLPSRAALSASYHHSDGRPERPYFGIGSARLKRSQRA